MILAMEDAVFLPMNFIEGSEYEEVMHDITNYISLEELNHNTKYVLMVPNAAEIFEILYELIKKLLFINEYLIFAENLELSLKTIYISALHPENKGIKILFRPMSRFEEQEMTLNQKLCALIDELELFYEDGLISQYLNHLKEKLLYNCSMQEFLKELSIIIREF